LVGHSGLERLEVVVGKGEGVEDRGGSWVVGGTRLELVTSCV
jgi:hypothetical protein